MQRLLFWSSFGVNLKKHCYLSCSTCRAARYLECIFDALENIACICGALNKSKFKAQHAVVNSSFAVSNAKSTTHAKTTFPLRIFCQTFGTFFFTNFCAQDRTPAIAEWGYIVFAKVCFTVSPTTLVDKIIQNQRAGRGAGVPISRMFCHIDFNDDILSNCRVWVRVKSARESWSVNILDTLIRTTFVGCSICMLGAASALVVGSEVKINGQTARNILGVVWT